LENKSTVWLDELRKECVQRSARNPGAAALMSFFVMGLGQIYAGHVDRGIMLMGIHLSGILSIYSVYSGGILYETVVPLLGAGAIVIFSYFCCVVFILLWIYNIKDAYYLSLFSSFRDWFEVERVLLPVLQGQSDKLLGGPQTASASLAYNDEQNSIKEETIEHVEAEDAHEVSYKIKPEAVDETDDSVITKKQKESSELDQEIPYADAIEFNPHSWKLYAGLVLIFILVGLWLHKRNIDPVEHFNPDEASQAHIAMAIDFNTESEPPSSVASEAAGVLPLTVNEPPPPFAEGIKQAGAGNYAQACALFEKDLLVTRPDKVTWQVILNAFYRSENSLAYELKLRDYLKEHSKDSLAWFNLGKVLYDRKELAQAASAIVKGLKIDPDNVRGSFLLGSLYIDLQLYDDAIEHLQRAVAFEPLNRSFLLSLAQSLHKAQKLNEAMKYYQRVLGLDPDNAEARKAVKRINFKKMVNKSGPQTAAVSRESGALQDQVVVIQGNKETKVIQVSESEQTFAPNGSKVLFDNSEDDEQANSGKVLFSAPQDEEPGENDLIEKEPDEKEPASRENIKDAKPAIQTETQVMEPQIAVNTDAGVSAIAISKKEDSDASLMNSVAVEPSGAQEAIEALRKSAFNEYARGNWQQSLPLYLEYLKKKKDPRAYDVVSILFEKLNMKDAAFEAAEQAYNLGLRELPNLIRLGRLAEVNQSYIKGERFLQKALEKSPHRIDLRIRLARCQAGTGNFSAALANLKSIKSDSSYSYAVKTRVESEIKQITKLQKN
jgi:tetratricopeptide (TPR) repeat protein